MNIGMLWFDNDPKADLEAKITGAAGYYEKNTVWHLTCVSCTPASSKTAS